MAKFCMFRSGGQIGICRIGKPNGDDRQGEVLTIIEGDSRGGKLISMIEQMDGYLDDENSLIKALEELLTLANLASKPL